MAEDTVETTNSGETVEKDSQGRFKKGHKRLGGNIKGSEHFRTSFEKFLKDVAAKNKMGDLDDVFKQAFTAVLKKAGEGDIQAFNSLMDRFYGKPTETVEIKGAKKLLVDMKI